MNNTLVSLIVAEAQPEAAKFTTTEDRLRAAFKVARNHFMAPDDSTALVAGLCAVHAISTPEEQERIVRAKKAIDALSALISGVPVDLEAVEANAAPLPLMDIFRSAA
jgi:hypothetical protein